MASVEDFLEEYSGVLWKAGQTARSIEVGEAVKEVVARRAELTVAEAEIERQAAIIKRQHKRERQHRAVIKKLQDEFGLTAATRLEGPEE